MTRYCTTYLRTGTKLITEEGIRPTTENDEIRPISSEVGVLPRARLRLFARGRRRFYGATLVPWDVQILTGLLMSQDTCTATNSALALERQDYEAGRSGHGALAEELWNMIPSEEEFPYTIRLVSEVLSSNGSTSRPQFAEAHWH